MLLSYLIVWATVHWGKSLAPCLSIILSQQSDSKLSIGLPGAGPFMEVAWESAPSGEGRCVYGYVLPYLCWKGKLIAFFHSRPVVFVIRGAWKASLQVSGSAEKCAQTGEE